MLCFAFAEDEFTSRSHWQILRSASGWFHLSFGL